MSSVQSGTQSRDSTNLSSDSSMLPGGISKRWKKIRLETESELRENPEVLDHSMETTLESLRETKETFTSGRKRKRTTYQIDVENRRKIINDEFNFVPDPDVLHEGKLPTDSLDEGITSNEGKNLPDRDENVETQDESIFVKKTGNKDVREGLCNNRFGDLLSMVSVDGGLRRIELSDNQGVGMISNVQCTLSHLGEALRDHHDKTLSQTGVVVQEDEGTKKSYHEFLLAMYDPDLCDYSNEEIVTNWLMLHIEEPIFIFNFFADHDEVNRFFHNMWLKTIPNFSRLLRSDYTQYWSVSMLITLLHATVQSTFSDYVRNKLFGSDSGSVSKFDEFLGKHLLFTSDLPFEKELYDEHLSIMGTLAYPHRPPFKMDLADIMISLSCIAHAWQSWSFWFGYVFMTVPISEASKLVEQDECLAYSSIAKCYVLEIDLIEPIGLTVNDPHPLSSKKLVEHVKFMFVSLSIYIHWLRVRTIEIMSHDSMDPENSKVREALMTIDVLTSYYQTIFKVYRTCYTPHSSFHNLRDFADLVFSRSTYSVSGEDVYGTIVPPDELCTRLSKEALRVASDGNISETILADINDCLTPIHIEPLYYCRNSGQESNIKVAPKETLPGSVATNRTEVLIMREGSVKHLDSVIPFDHKWAINHALQVQAIETLIKQFIPKFSFNEAVMLRELEIAETVEFTEADSWEDVTSNWTKRIDPLKLYPTEDAFVDGKSPEIKLKFRDEEEGVKDAVIMKIGCVYLMTGRGYSFCSPCLTEAFIAWTLLKDSIIGWDTDYYIPTINKDKKRVSKLAVGDLSLFIQRIAFGDFDSETLPGQ